MTTLNDPDIPESDETPSEGELWVFFDPGVLDHEHIRETIHTSLSVYEITGHNDPDVDNAPDIFTGIPRWDPDNVQRVGTEYNWILGKLLRFPLPEPADEWTDDYRQLLDEAHKRWRRPELLKLLAGERANTTGGYDAIFHEIILDIELVLNEFEDITDTRAEIRRLRHILDGKPDVIIDYVLHERMSELEDQDDLDTYDAIILFELYGLRERLLDEVHTPRMIDIVSEHELEHEYPTFDLEDDD